MPFLLSYKFKPLVGIDIQTDEIRLVQLKQEKNSGKINKISVAKLQPGTIVGGQITNEDEVITEIKKLVVTHNLKGYPAAISMRSNRVMTQYIKINENLKKKEGEIEILSNFKKYFPSISGELFLDYVKVDQDIYNQANWLLIAIHPELVRHYVRVVNQTGLTVKIVDVDTFVIERALKSLNFLPNCIALLLLNLDYYDFYVFRSNKAIFYHQLSIHSRNEHELTQQVKLAMQLFSSSHPHLIFDTVLLAGKFIENLSVLLQSECQIKAYYIDDVLKDKLTKRKEIVNPSSLLLAYGLALRSPNWKK